MPWSFPVSLLASRNTFGKTFDAVDGKQTDLNLFDFFGNPSGPSDVNIIFDGIDVCSLSLGNFRPDSIFSITLINDAAIFGRGGNGGTGGESFPEGLISQCLGFPGTSGGNGGGALVMLQAYTLNIDLDDGYSWGGGGGGGGGGITFTWPSCKSGAGGGGAQGWQATFGGPGLFCDNGSAGGPGGFGAGGGTSGGTCFAGGNGGPWGRRGVSGPDSGGGNFGDGGRAIQTFVGSTVNLTGAKNQATLESENRLIGRNSDPIGLP